MGVNYIGDAQMVKNSLERTLHEQGRKKSWLARQLGVSNSTVTKWLKGEARPTDDKKVKISTLLGVPVEELFFERSVN